MAVRVLDVLSDQVSVNSLMLINTNKLDPTAGTAEIRPTRYLHPRFIQLESTATHEKLV